MTVEENLGAATSSACPRSGSVLLESWKGNVGIVNTTCNTWRCKGCRDRIRNRFKKLVSSGVSTLGRCSFTTITYQADSERLKDARCVARDWQALLRLLKKCEPQVAKMQWLRVMELTKRGTPHHHLVMGPVPKTMEIACWHGKLHAPKFNSRLDCDCLAHRISRQWLKVTGDSWVVHTIIVSGANGAGGYMAKYMGKEFDGERAEYLGMARRWSNSRGWPGPRRNRLAHSKSAGGLGYRRNVYRFGQVDEEVLGKSDEEVLKRLFEADIDEKKKAMRRFIGALKGSVKHA